MADKSSDQNSGETSVRPSGDGATTGRPSAPGAANVAWGRTSGDLITDQPAAHGGPDLQSNAGNQPGSHDVTGEWGATKVDPNAGGDIRQGRRRDLHPDIDPDARLGLRPAISSDQLPDQLPNSPSDTPTRAVTGAVAGVIAATILAALVYALFWAGIAGVPTFVVVERTLLGSNGWLDHLLGLVGFLVVGGIWGALFGALVSRPTMLKGVAFGLLPTLVDWLITAPMTGHGLFNRGTAAGIGLPLLYHALIWGGVLGHLCGRWLRPPYTAATGPSTTTGDLA